MRVAVSSLRVLLCCLIPLAASACVRTQPRAVLRPTASVARPTPAPMATAAPTAPSARLVRVTGSALAPTALEARTANVKNGYAIGTPIKVLDAATGRVLKQDVTYYDGSFQLDLSAPSAAQPVVLAVELVDADDPEETLSLEAPLVLEKAVSTLSGVHLTTGSTALVMMYRRWAAAEKGAQPAAQAFARYVGSTDTDATKSFGLLVAQDAQIPAATDVASLRAALEAYVPRTQAKKAIAD